MPAPKNMRAKVKRRRVSVPSAAGLARAQGMVYGAPGLAAAQGLAYAPFGVPTVPPPPGFGGGKVTPPVVPGTPPVSHFEGWMSDAAIRAQAAKEAQLAYGPQRAELLRAKLADQQAAAAQARSQQGFALAGANLLKGVGAEVTGAYRGAAQDTATFAKGYSDGLAHVQQQSADSANQTISAAGGGPGQMLQGDHGAANVLYGVGGYIPASTLEREGAAFGAAALKAPGVALGQGRADVAKTYADQRKRALEYDARMSDLSTQQRGVIEKAIYDTKRDQLSLKQYDTQRTEQKAAALAQAESAAEATAWDRKFKVAGLQQAAQIAASTLGLNMEKLTGQQRIDIANLIGYDPVTKAPTLKATASAFDQTYKTAKLGLEKQWRLAKNQNDRTRLGLEIRKLDLATAKADAATQLALKKLGLQDQALQLKALDLQWKMKHPKKPGGFTAAQKLKFRGRALDIALGARHGGTNPKTGEVVDPITYREAIEQMTIAGIPLTIAQQALDKQYPKGERDVEGQLMQTIRKLFP